MAYWMRLKLHLLPCIAQEVDVVSKDYFGNFQEAAALMKKLDLVEKLRNGQRDAHEKLLNLQAAV
jgi:hypothetical protein